MLEKALTPGKVFNFSEPKIVKPNFNNGDFVPLPETTINLAGTDCQWLHFWAGAITSVELNRYDVFTGPFSGCFIAVFKQAGKFRITHLGTGPTKTDQETVQVKDQWLTFAKTHPPDLVVAYNPLRQWEAGGFPFAPKGQVPLGSLPLYAFVTAAEPHQCYGVLMWPQIGATGGNRKVVDIQRLLPIKHGLELQNMMRYP